MGKDLPSPDSNLSFTAHIEAKHQPRPIFADSTRLKERLKSSISSLPSYNVEDFYWKEGIWQQIARNWLFEYITLAVIAVNAVWIAVEVELNPAELLIDSHPFFQAVEHAFCVYFAVEWFVRLRAFRVKSQMLKDRWFVFDSMLALLMVMETWVMTLFVAVTGHRGDGGALGGVSILRLVRLLRLTRMARVARLLRAFPEMLIMVKGILAAMHSVIFTMALLFIIIYMFGIALRQETAGTEAGALHFSTVFQSMFTLVISATLLDSPGRVLEDIGMGNMLAGTLFFIVILLSALLLLNMLVGVLCEVVSNVSAREKEQLSVSFVNERVWRVLEEAGLDQNADGRISKDELLTILGNEAAARHLQEAGVDVVGLVDFADVIFQSDENGQEYERQLDFADFMKLVLQHRGSNAATVRDFVDLRKFMHTRNTQASNQLARVEDRLRRMESRMSALARGGPVPGEVRRSCHVPPPPIEVAPSHEASCAETVLSEGAAAAAQSPVVQLGLPSDVLPQQDGVVVMSPVAVEELKACVSRLEEFGTSTLQLPAMQLPESLTDPGAPACPHGAAAPEGPSRSSSHPTCILDDTGLRITMKTPRLASSLSRGREPVPLPVQSARVGHDAPLGWQLPHEPDQFHEQYITLKTPCTSAEELANMAVA